MANLDNLTDIIIFVHYIDQLKQVIRKNALHDGSRPENTAEHSWHAALSALLLSEYANQPINVNEVVKMLLVHDLIEIESGDTFLYDQEEVAKQDEAEAKAADVVFGQLPEKQGEELRKLWETFEARETPEAKFAKAIDRLLPLYSNISNQGFSWEPNHVTRSQIIEVADIIQDGSSILWDLVQELLATAVDEGYLNP
jgi:putative hydrolase of HD superfamily